MKATNKMLTAGILLAFPLFADAQATQPTAPAAAQSVQSLPVYKPPLRGAPSSRVGGASRGITEARVTLDVLAPDHTGLTISEQPSLYWYLSAPVAAPLEFTLIDQAAVHPLAEIQLKAPDAPGIQRLDLSAHGVKLEPGIEYQWFVTLVPDPRQRSNDVLAGGTIERIEAPPALTARLAGASDQQLTYVYAQEGLWYDAIAAISGLINASPEDDGLRAQRAALLEQVGLDRVAAQDKAIALR
jgi:hypothetical protein